VICSLRKASSQLPTRWLRRARPPPRRAARSKALAMLRDAGVETIVVDPETHTTEAA
jgi:hypothetical protein